jgi:hypothetical protein
MATRYDNYANLLRIRSCLQQELKLAEKRLEVSHSRRQEALRTLQNKTLRTVSALKQLQISISKLETALSTLKSQRTQVDRPNLKSLETCLLLAIADQKKQLEAVFTSMQTISTRRLQFVKENILNKEILEEVQRVAMDRGNIAVLKLEYQMEKIRLDSFIAYFSKPIPNTLEQTPPITVDSLTLRRDELISQVEKTMERVSLCAKESAIHESYTVFANEAKSIRNAMINQSLEEINLKSRATAEASAQLAFLCGAISHHTRITLANVELCNQLRVHLCNMKESLSPPTSSPPAPQRRENSYLIALSQLLQVAPSVGVIEKRIPTLQLDAASLKESLNSLLHRSLAAKSEIAALIKKICSSISDPLENKDVFNAVEHLASVAGSFTLEVQQASLLLENSCRATISERFLNGVVQLLEANDLALIKNSVRS